MHAFIQRKNDNSLSLCRHEKLLYDLNSCFGVGQEHIMGQSTSSKIDPKNFLRERKRENDRFIPAARA